MQCSACHQQLDSQKSGFIVCPNCGTVNMPVTGTSPAHVNAPHVKRSRRAFRLHPSKQLFKSKLFLLGSGSMLIVIVISGVLVAHMQGASNIQTPTTQPTVAKSETPPPTAPPETTPKPKAKKTPATQPAAEAPPDYSLKVLVLKYFPLTANGQNIDANVTGDVGDSYSVIRQRTTDITNNLQATIKKATKYRGYSNSSAPSALSYSIVDTKEFTQAVPIKASHGRPTYPDYAGIMTANNICDYVNNKQVREVWIWAYQGPNKADGFPSLGIDESKMSSVYGDISNSWRYDDMPKCAHSYMVYTYNYGRGTAEAFHSWGHQIESELTAVDNHLFRDLFQGAAHPQVQGVNGRCGSVHNPPNSRSEYDYANSAPQKSDCLDWQPDGLGQLTSISCQTWGCQNISDSNNPQLNWLVWTWQNMPGHGNTKTYQGKQLRNWWDVHGNFDGVMGGKRSLVNS